MRNKFFQVSKFMASKHGVLDLDVFDYNLVFNTGVNLGLSKANRLLYGDSEMTHAMVITAIHEEVILNLQYFTFCPFLRLLEPIPILRLKNTQR